MKKSGAMYVSPSGHNITPHGVIKKNYGGDCVTIKQGGLWATPCTNVTYVACEKL
jgi:hypothetical protein